MSPSTYFSVCSKQNLYITFHSIKKAFRRHRETLKETGHGLIANDDEASIHPDSEIANAWGMLLINSIVLIHSYTLTDKIKSSFPWYKRINDLMGTSPAVDKSALAHSTSPLDLMVLGDHASYSGGQLDSDLDVGYYFPINCGLLSLNHCLG